MNGKNPQFNDLRELFEFRRETYEAACDIKIDTHEKTIDSIVADIKKQLSL
jgi:shikimate kinase